MAREMNASEEQERESSEWNVRELSAGEFDALSAASEYGGFQQTSEMAILAQSEGMQTQYVGLVDSHDAPVAGALVAFSQGRFGVEGSLWLGPLCNGNDRADDRVDRRFARGCRTGSRHQPDVLAEPGVLRSRFARQGHGRTQ